MKRPQKHARSTFLILSIISGTGALEAQTERWGYLREMFPRTTVWPEGGAVGDVDGDGDLDLYAAVATQGFPSLSGQDRLFLNDGRGRFVGASSRLPVENDETFAVALGDIDNDGDLDAVVANVGAPCRIYRNLGQGFFQDAPALYPAQPSPGPAFHAVALEDFDRDGDLDAFFAGETKLLWLNRGSLFVDFTAANLPLGTNSAWTRDVAAGDLDGDADLDLVLGNLGGSSAGGQSEIYLNTGNGSFIDATSTHLPPVSKPTWAVELGDVDGDRDLDLYLANIHHGLPSAAQDQLFVNVGGGRFVEVPSALPSETYNTNDARFADLDGDGDLDVLAANGHRSALPSQPDLVLLNDGSGTFTPSATGFTGSLIELSPHRLMPGDFDADGDTDCVALQTIEARVFLNRGNAELVDVTHRYPWLIDCAIAPADYDGDGIADLAAISDGGPIPSAGRRIRNCLLLRGRGNGEFLDASLQLPNDIPDADVLAAGDLDGDGDLDLVFGTFNYAGGPSRLVFARNDGAGNFAIAASLPVDQGVTHLKLGDLDGDNRLDIAMVVGWLANWSRVYLNRGAWNFAELANAVPLHPGATTELGLGDLDGDGDLDLFAAKGNAGGILGFENRIYLNAGNGMFATSLGALPPHADPSESVSLGDVDGDGDLDALVGNGANVVGGRLPFGNRLYLNGGNGIFFDSTGSLPALPPDATFDVALSDLDGDGDLDAYISNAGEQDRLYRNNGLGGFFDASAELPISMGSGGAVAIVDVDRDGDPDLCSASQSSLVLFNLRSQLSWRTPQSLGKSFAMDLHGDPGAPWALLASPGTASIAISPLGSLYLDPANLALAATGSFDAQGRATVDFRVPRWRALLGQAVYWQAAINFTPRLGNFEITTVTDF
ncbi:MAG: VCBS repeat-containing protein [Planctomycetes bacterium]|nr:VCBS repeat-containing protein [Planctomycetota bacterium]